MEKGPEILYNVKYHQNTNRRTDPMNDFSTELIKSLYLDENKFKEMMRELLEKTVNTLLEEELSGFLGYERYAYDGRKSGDSRNGSYARTVDSQFGELHITVPRDRSGEFHQHTVPEYARRTECLEQTVIQLYSHGVTTGEIADLIERMYGCYYSKATVSNLARTAENLAAQFHTRPVEARYAVIYCDSTYLHVRRDTVEPEALHIILGITPEGRKEVLDYALYPSESAQNYREMLEKLKERGLKEVLLFVSDGLTGLPNALREVFPKARYQSCWVHLSRNVFRLVRRKDRPEILTALKGVYTQETAEKARETLEAFLNTYAGKYPKLRTLLADNGNLFTFYGFPKEIRRSIYTSNLIERCNKDLKKNYKRKEQFPNEDSLERYVASVLSEYNRRFGRLSHHGFSAAQAELNAMFENS